MRARTHLLAAALSLAVLPQPAHAGASTMWLPAPKPIDYPWTSYPAAFSNGVGYVQGQWLPGFATQVEGSRVEWRTTDYGRSWTPFTIPGATAANVAFATPDVGYDYDGTRGVYRSADGGATWTATPGLPLAAGESLHLWFDDTYAVGPDGDTVAVGGDVRAAPTPSCPSGYLRGSVMWSTDDGTTFTEGTFTDHVFQLAVHDATTGVALTRPLPGCAGEYGDASVWVTTDSGATWTRVLTPSASMRPTTAAFAGDGTLLVGGEGGEIARSTDDGAHFTVATLDNETPLDHVHTPVLTWDDYAHPYVDSFGFAGTTGYAVQGGRTIWRTTDAGATWTQDATLTDPVGALFPSMRDLAVFDGEHAFVLDGHLYTRTTF